MRLMQFSLFDYGEIVDVTARVAASKSLDNDSPRVREKSQSMCRIPAFNGVDCECEEAGGLAACCECHQLRFSSWLTNLATP